jgi:hypothetical protein
VKNLALKLQLIPILSILSKKRSVLSDPGQADLVGSANAALSVRGGPPPPTPPRRVPACGDSPIGQGWRSTPGPRISSCLLATAKPCSLRAPGLSACRWHRALRCTASLYRLALRASFDFMALHCALPPDP